MAFSDWLIYAGAAWLLGKSISNAAEERERIEQKNREYEEEYKRTQAEYTRRSAVNNQRKNTPCLFTDGISYEEFSELAYKIGRKLNRVKTVSVTGPIIDCTVESQSGYSTWEFTLDFNDWGHITGTRWTWTENDDSSAPLKFGGMMTTAIHQLYEERNVHLEDYSDAVDVNNTLETPHGLSFHKKAGIFKKIFSKEKTLICRHSAQSLRGEHIYPVVSFLRDNGFRFVSSTPIKDVGRGSSHFQFEVEQVTIDGNASFHAGDVFKERSKVSITYHEKQEITIPFDEGHFKKRNFVEVGDELQALGFSEIYELPIRDLTTGWLKKDGSVEKITIADNDSFKKNTAYKFDTPINIHYHTFK